jgi:hypothetical protein
MQEAAKETSCDSQKRPLETEAAAEEEEQQQPKRIKDDLTAGPPAIPAGGE